VTTPLVKDMNGVMKFDQRFVRDYLDTTHELKQRVLDESKKLEGELGDLDANRFNFLKDKCNGLDGLAKKVCNKAVTANIRNLIKEAKVETNVIKTQIKEIREEIKNKHLFKMEQLKTIKDNIEVDADEFERFKTLPYYAIKDKCGYKLKDDSKLMSHLKEHPEMQEYADDIEQSDQNIDNLNAALKTDINAYTNRIQQLNDLLKTDLDNLEKAAIKQMIKDATKEMRTNISQRKSDVKGDILAINKHKKQVEGDRKKSLRETRKNIKNTLKTEKKTEKDLKRADVKLKKTLRKTGELREEIEHDLLKGLVAKYNGQIDNDVDAAVEAVQAKIDEKQRKIDEKALAKRNKTEKKAKANEEKALAKRNKTEKANRDKEEKAKNKEEKAKDKEEKAKEEKAKRNKTKKSK